MTASRASQSPAQGLILRQPKYLMNGLTFSSFKNLPYNVIFCKGNLSSLMAFACSRKRGGPWFDMEPGVMHMGYGSCSVTWDISEHAGLSYKIGMTMAVPNETLRALTEFTPDHFPGRVGRTEPPWATAAVSIRAPTAHPCHSSIRTGVTGTGVPAVSWSLPPSGHCAFSIRGGRVVMASS